MLCQWFYYLNKIRIKKKGIVYDQEGIQALLIK